MIPENRDNDTPTPRLAYTPQEVATLTPLSLKAVYAALNSGELKGRRMTARRWLISRENLLAYLSGAEGEGGETQ